MPTFPDEAPTTFRARVVVDRALEVECPTCKASVGYRCQRIFMGHGMMIMPHYSRVEASSKAAFHFQKEDS